MATAIRNLESLTQQDRDQAFGRAYRTIVSLSSDPAEIVSHLVAFGRAIEAHGHPDLACAWTLYLCAPATD